ncbi:hypothetical protein V3C99_005419 [Haemonchus contortus]|nr:unnamed protein product [Haemonchus contortus]
MSQSTAIQVDERDGMGTRGDGLEKEGVNEEMLEEELPTFPRKYTAPTGAHALSENSDIPLKSSSGCGDIDETKRGHIVSTCAMNSSKRQDDEQATQISTACGVEENMNQGGNRPATPKKVQMSPPALPPKSEESVSTCNTIAMGSEEEHPVAKLKVIKLDDADEDAREPRLKAGSSADGSVYYGCGEARTDMLVALGILFGTMILSFIILLDPAGSKRPLFLAIFALFKLIVFIVGYFGARNDNRILLICTIILTAVALVGSVYFAARAIVEVTDHPAKTSIRNFIICVVELAVLIHIIYYSVKIM